MDDGVELAATLVQPFGLSAPAPGVVVLHGIGGNRSQVTAITEGLARDGYVVLSYDARAHGQSGGLFSAARVREIADLRAVHDWLSGTPEVIDDRVGALGHLVRRRRRCCARSSRACPSAPPSWPRRGSTSTQRWLPQPLEVGGVFAFLDSVPAERRRARGERRRRRRAREPEHGHRARLRRRALEPVGPRPRVTTPMLFMQGRRDFAFGLDQGLAAYDALGGPKRLYIGPFGHAPSTFPGPDIELQKQRALAWFDHYLRGVPNGIETAPKVELAPETGGTPVGSASLPRTVTRSYRLPGRSTFGSAGKVVRRARLARAVETFGAPTVDVQAASTTGWSHLVAVLVARTPQGQELVVSEGGAPTKLGSKPRRVRIRMIGVAKKIPAGSRLELTLAGTSTAQNAANLLYLVPVSTGCEDHRPERVARDSRPPHAGHEMRRAALLALVATLVAIPGAYARPSATPGVTGSTILLGGSGPLSGPEVSYAGTMIGAKAYFDYVNANGGVFGRKIEYRYLDDAYDPSRTVQNVRNSCSRTTCSRSST